MPRYVLTIFLSAFLLFQVQPLIGQFILPGFGGSAGVWTTCMLVFQALLLAGYAYAHLLSNCLRPTWTAALHGCLLAVSIGFLPIAPDESWRPGRVEWPTVGILWILLSHIGVPFLLLSSTGPLLQNWFSRTSPGRSPYRLYALSNAGSLLALVSYPFLFQPTLMLRVQGWVWSGGYLAFVLSCGWCAWRFRQADSDRSKFVNGQDLIGLDGPSASPHVIEAASPSKSPNDRPIAVQMCLWLVLAAVGSLMLLATTNQVCQDLTVVPLLWVAPLAVYLITFIICFDHDRWYRRILFIPLLGVSVLVTNMMLHEIGPWSLGRQIAVYGVTLFAACMVCHGELVRLKPALRYLTKFYLLIATGGALGGATAALVAPLLFQDYWEYHLGLGATSLLTVVCIYHSKRGQLSPVKLRSGLAAGLTICLMLLASLLWHIVDNGRRDIATFRSFYGVLHLRESHHPITGTARRIVHGQVAHGVQFQDPDKRRWPTSYYGYQSGIGLAIRHLAQPSVPAGDRPKLRIGVIGLGAGTIATLTGPGDTVRFYEINPDVERICQDYFTFLDDSPSQTDVLLGDGRIVLEREAQNGQEKLFDVLAIDAFNSDAIPIHLLTKEAFDVYRSHVKPNGLIAYHITNQNLDLRPVIHGLAKAEGFESVTIVSARHPDLDGTLHAVWVIVTKNHLFLDSPRIKLAANRTPRGPMRVWTDDFASLATVIRRGGTLRIGRWDLTPNHGRFVMDKADLVEPEDEDRLFWQLRKLYDETNGRFPTMVLTLDHVPRDVNGIPIMSLADYSMGSYAQLGLINHQEHDRGLLMTISVQDRQAMINLGDGWDEQRHVEVQKVLDSTVLPGLKEGNPSQAIIAGVELLSRMVRRVYEQERGRD